jgi:lysophospholipase L1-like esterase
MKGFLMKILCLGDSLTFGSVGFSYIPWLGANIQPVNKGKNGDTVRGARRRLQRYLKQSKYDAVSTVVVWIGVNDLLVPFLATLSPLWKMVMKPRCAYKRCKEEDAAFAAEYERMLDLLKKSGKRAVLVGLPVVQIEGFPPERLKSRNAVIQDLAKKHSLPYVDAYALQSEALHDRREEYSWGVFWLNRLADAAIMALFQSTKDRCAKKRSLTLTVDGVHLASRSAKLLGAEIGRKVLHPAD